MLFFDIVQPTFLRYQTMGPKKGRGLAKVAPEAAKDKLESAKDAAVVNQTMMARRRMGRWVTICYWPFPCWLLEDNGLWETFVKLWNVRLDHDAFLDIVGPDMRTNIFHKSHKYRYSSKSSRLKNTGGEPPSLLFDTQFIYPTWWSSFVWGQGERGSPKFTPWSGLEVTQLSLHGGKMTRIRMNNEWGWRYHRNRNITTFNGWII